MFNKADNTFIKTDKRINEVDERIDENDDTFSDFDKRIINFDDRFILTNIDSSTSLQFWTQPPSINDMSDEEVDRKEKSVPIQIKTTSSTTSERRKPRRATTRATKEFKTSPSTTAKKARRKLPAVSAPGDRCASMMYTSCVAVQQDILNLVNHIRRKQNAANMMKMQWDIKYMQMAQRQTDKCNMDSPFQSSDISWSGTEMTSDNTLHSWNSTFRYWLKATKRFPSTCGISRSNEPRVRHLITRRAMYKPCWTTIWLFCTSSLATPNKNFFRTCRWFGVRRTYSVCTACVDYSMWSCCQPCYVRPVQL